jgi:hypothetical protein
MTITDKPIDIEALRRFIAPAPSSPAPAPAVPAHIAAAAKELDGIREVSKTLKERERNLRTLLLDFLSTEGVDSVAGDGVSISKSSHMREGIDKDRMKTFYPRVLADVLTETPVTQVRVEVQG